MSTAKKTEITEAHLKTRKARAQARRDGIIEPRGRPYSVSIGPGVRLGYRCNKGDDGTWVKLEADGSGGTATKALGVADDRLDADGVNVLDYGQAFRKALEQAIGSAVPLDADGKQIKLTVTIAVGRYKDRLVKRAGNVGNATQIVYHLKDRPVLAKKLVSATRKPDIEGFQDMLIKKKLKAATVNRIMTSLNAALNLAAKDFPDQVTGRPWSEVEDLKVPKGEVSDTVFLTGEQIEHLINEVDRRRGTLCADWVWTHAETGQRTEQVNQLNIEDLRDAKTGSPWLLMWTSRKGKDKEPTHDLVVSISTALAGRLLAAAGKRAPTEPLLLNTMGRRAQWSFCFYKRPGGRPRANIVSDIAADLKFPRTKQGNLCTLYALRHSSIIRMLRDPHLNAYEVARYHDTSIEMLQAHYASEMHKSAGDRVSRTLPEISIGKRDAKVIRLKR